MLNTPENDTQDLAGVLRSAGFKVVSLVNLTKIEMDQVNSLSIACSQQCCVYLPQFLSPHKHSHVPRTLHRLWTTLQH